MEFFTCILDELASSPKEIDRMKQSMNNVVNNIKYQRQISKEQDRFITVMPSNIKDISVGDIVMMELGVNYPCETWYSHWCYILRASAYKFLVIPCVSLKDSVNNDYEMVIDTVINGEVQQSVMLFEQIRSVDKQRVRDNVPIGKVLTPKSMIRKRVFEYLEKEM